MKKVLLFSMVIMISNTYSSQARGGLSHAGHSQSAEQREFENLYAKLKGYGEILMDKIVLTKSSEELRNLSRALEDASSLMYKRAQQKTFSQRKNEQFHEEIEDFAKKHSKYLHFYDRTDASNMFSDFGTTRLGFTNFLDKMGAQPYDPTDQMNMFRD